jgi:hypothetical protein
MPRDNREVERTLIRKFNFTRADRRADDHRWLQLKVGNLPTIFTKLSHTREDISERIWGLIAQQLKVRTPYLNGMVDCTNSKDAYYNLLETDPYPPWPNFPQKAAQKDAPSKKGRQRRRR